jgi:hypothetical protein
VDSRDKSGVVLVGTVKGLFRFNDRTGLVPVPGGEAIGDVKWIQETKAMGVLVGIAERQRGLFRYDDRLGVVPASVGDSIDWANSILETRTGILLVGTNAGLFRYDGHSHFVEIQSGTWVNSIRETNSGVVLVGDQDGLSRYDDKLGLQKLPGWDSIGPVESIWVSKSGTVLVGSQKGLYRYEETSGVTQMPRGSFLGTIDFVLETKAGVILAVTGIENAMYTRSFGVYRYDAKSSFVQVPGGASPYRVNSMTETTAGDILVGGVNGLFRINYQPLAGAVVELIDPRPSEFPQPNSTPIGITWSLSHPCAPFAEELGLAVIATDGSQVLPKIAAVGFQNKGAAMDFMANVPIVKRWRLDVSSCLRPIRF